MSDDYKFKNKDLEKCFEKLVDFFNKLKLYEYLKEVLLMSKEPIIKIREISEKELQEILKKEKPIFIETEEDIDNFSKELDKKLEGLEDE